MEGKGATALMVLLLAVRVSRSSVFSRPYSSFDNTSVDTSQSFNTVHNITVDCGDKGALKILLCSVIAKYCSWQVTAILGLLTVARENPNIIRM